MVRNNSLTKAVLLVLEKTVDGCVRLDDFASQNYLYKYGYNRPLKKSSLAQALKRLREKGLIDFMDQEKIIVRITEPGKDQALWVKMREENEQKWDGRWRLVIWDIPEKRKAVRDVFRARLKQLGFNQWQKSVWVSKKNCTQLLRNFIKRVGIEDWVMVVESDNVGFNTKM